MTPARCLCSRSKLAEFERSLWSAEQFNAEQALCYFLAVQRLCDDVDAWSLGGDEGEVSRRALQAYGFALALRGASSPLPTVPSMRGARPGRVHCRPARAPSGDLSPGPVSARPLGSPRTGSVALRLVAAVLARLFPSQSPVGVSNSTVAGRGAAASRPSEGGHA